MSRTYRNGIDWRVKAGYCLYTLDQYYKLYSLYRRSADEYYQVLGWKHIGIRSHKCRDGARNNGTMNGIPKWYKQARRRRERRQEHQAVHMGKEPVFTKKDDAWYW